MRGGILLKGLSIGLAGLLLNGCIDFGGGSGESSVELPPPLKKITPADGPAMLERWIKAGFHRANQLSPTGSGAEPGIIATPTSTNGDTGSSAGYSSTNLQEAGVDEADRVKNDGQWLYLLKPQQTVWPQSGGVAVANSTAPAQTTAELRILQMAGNPARVSEQARLPLPADTGAAGLYLYSSTGTASDRLALVGDGGRDGSWGWGSPWDWYAGKVDLSLVDVSDRSQPQLSGQLALDGHLIASRRIGSRLYLVTRHTPQIEGFEAYPGSEAARRANEQRVQAATLSQLLPDWYWNGQNRGDLIGAENCYVLPVAQSAYSPDLVTVVAVDLAQPDAAPKATCLVGPTETVYASTEALYLASTRYDYQNDMPVSIAMTAVAAREGSGIETDLHKFAFTDAGPVYRGSGTVPGHLGWDWDQRSFRFGEYQGLLRVVTSQLSGDPQNRLTILAEQDGALVERSHLPNAQRTESLGKPGEQVYAVRYQGERAFVVTFRQTDPLYVLDLSDPADPFVAGSLEIPGYSDYLHPAGNYLVGIGYDAVAAPDGWGDGRGALLQGTRISLFDISNPAAPVELDHALIGQRGSHAGTVWDHHALAWLPADPATSRPARLALPVQMHDTASAYAGSSWYDWTHTALYLFDVDVSGGGTGLTPRGTVVAEQRSGTTSWPQEWVSEDRAVLVGDDVHYLHGQQVWSTAWGNTGSVNAAQ